MKPLVFLSAFDYPTKFAHAVHGLHMARAFAQVTGLPFMFVVNADAHNTLADIPHALLFGRWGRRIKKLRLRRALQPWALTLFFLKNRHFRGATLFVNDVALLPLAACMRWWWGGQIIFESHVLPTPRIGARVARYAHTVVCVTEGIATAFRQYVESARVMVLPNAVAVHAYERVTKEAVHNARCTFGVPQEAWVVGYVGRLAPLGEDKGVMLMLDALSLLPEEVHLVCVGGAKGEVEQFTAHAHARGVDTRAHFVPHVPHDAVPAYVRACDVLAYVPPGGTAFFDAETSPMKLYEYMASRRPIIVSRLPTTESVLSEREALFVEPGDTHAYAAAVLEARRAMASGECARVDAAYARVQHNTWDTRAQTIVERAAA